MIDDDDDDDDDDDKKNLVICCMNSHTFTSFRLVPRILSPPFTFNPSHSFLTSCFALLYDKTALKIYCHVFGVRDYRRGMDW
jgi:hypothetical protein